MFLIFTCISFPSNVHRIYCFDQKIGFVCRDMGIMSIKPSTTLFFLMVFNGLCKLCSKLYILIVWNWGWCAIIRCNLGTRKLWTLMLDNSVLFNSIIKFNFLTLFNVIMLCFFPVEALHLMVLHRSRPVNLLDETHHRLFTVWLEWAVISRLEIWEFWCAICNWISTYIRVNIVSKICRKSITVVKFHSKCLIIDCTPCSTWWTRWSLSLSLVVISELNFPQIFAAKLEFMILRNNLNMIGSLVSTKFLCFK